MLIGLAENTAKVKHALDVTVFENEEGEVKLFNNRIVDKRGTDAILEELNKE